MGPQFTAQFKRFASEWEFDHVTSSPRHPKANGKAESAVKIAKNLLSRALRDSNDPWKAILQWRNTPTENMDSSPAQRLLSRRLKTTIPVANKLLEPCVMVGVTDKLRHRKQLAKCFYDRTARDLPELEVGETIRMKPLPGDHTGLWRLGTSLQRVAPRSYLVDVAISYLSLFPSISTPIAYLSLCFPPQRLKSLSHRRQSAPSLVINKALTRSRTFSRESFLVPVCPETCPLVQSFLCPDRVFLLHGHVTLKTGLQTQDRDLFLFTDILIIAKSKSPTHFKLKAQVCVGEMWTAQCMEDVCEGSTNPERSFVMGWPTCNCVVTFSSEVQKERWLSMLKSRIKEEKEKDDPKTIPLKVFGKGIGSCAQVVSKTLGVSNSDSTNEVVRLALQQFGVTSCVKDYQLWVSSKRDNAPYPLIGHEFPFSIQMSHMREPLAHPGRRDTVPPPDRQRAMHRDQVQVDKQCQFILKTRCSSTTTTPVIVDPAQKPFKRRRSLINWAFWKGSNPNLHSSSTNLSSPAPGYLFGQSLSTICWDNSLPKPVMDMLVFLYNEGPFTRGIFRRSAGARACRELRDRLDSGAQDVPLSREHVFIIAAVFKDFLRNIPGSLLCSDLYEQWMDVMEEAEEEEAEEEEQAQDITRLIGLLPKENSLLLRHVVAVLHGIQENAHDNQMNAFNLSVCIAPSMLWAPGPSSPEVEGRAPRSNEKVCDLVRYMIEHCQKVLGEDVTSVFGGLPRKRAESDVSSFHLTDSSYDSLENMLNDDSSESPCLHTSRRRWRAKPLQGSLDSVLTLSDCDQEHPDLDTDPDTTDPQSGNHHHCDTITQPGSGNLLQPSTPARGRTRKLSPAVPPPPVPAPQLLAGEGGGAQSRP
ncbi:rho GTPase-activating protein 20 [Oncorhynchus tshawytscha]|uniref:rho GTPase-activating protein 20 n=1 Tax=Oncorhynchus tshawytscha TaxID=74940 RepID=UPI001C3C8BA2|nr:rho GTPase-activating protein 20 [Oncorhynchus tshawytscha]